MTNFITPSISVGRSFTAGRAYAVRPGRGTTHEITSDLGHTKVVLLDSLGEKTPHLIPDLSADFPRKGRSRDMALDAAQWDIAGHFMACDKTGNVVHVDANGERWIISASTVYGYTYAHEDYDGPEDGRCGTGKSVQDCREWIEDCLE